MHYSGEKREQGKVMKWLKIVRKRMKDEDMKEMITR
jgi:hypothetical protein